MAKSKPLVGKQAEAMAQALDEIAAAQQKLYDAQRKLLALFRGEL